MKRFLMMILTLSVSVSTLGQTARTTVNKTMDRVKHPKDFQVIEFRKGKANAVELRDLRTRPLFRNNSARSIAGDTYAVDLSAADGHFRLRS